MGRRDGSGTAALPPGGRRLEHGLVSTDVSSDIEKGSGEDPSIFAIALETLAVKAFGDMGQTAHLKLIRDRFIAGHNNCELRRYLDSVPPETPIRDVVDRCRVSLVRNRFIRPM